MCPTFSFIILPYISLIRQSLEHPYSACDPYNNGETDQHRARMLIPNRQLNASSVGDML